MNNFSNYVVPENMQLIKALDRINQLGKNFVLVSTEHKISGVLTDGDVRRGILTGVDLNTTEVSQLMNREFKALGENHSASTALKIMKSNTIKQIPVIAADGSLLHIYFLSDFNTELYIPNEALIFAGGKGSRLSPLTEFTPKPMLKIGGIPILERIISELSAQGINNIHVAINYLGDQIKTYFGNGQEFGCNISYIEEKYPLGTAGALRLLPSPITNPIIVLNGDLIINTKLHELLLHHSKTKSNMTIVTGVYSHHIPFGVISNRGKNVIEVIEKPILEKFINRGIYVIDSSVIKIMEPDIPTSMTELIKLAILNGNTVTQYVDSSDWRDIGSMETYTALQEM